MNNIRFQKIFFTLILFPFFLFAKGEKGYDIKVRIGGLKDTVAYLGHHFGDKQYVRDTARIDKDGWVEFKGDTSLIGGIYLIVLPSKTYFEILVNRTEQKFIIETDTTDFIGKMKVKGSPDNEMFNSYQRFIGDRTKQSQALKARLDANKENKDSTKIIKEQMSALDKEVKEFRFGIMREHPDAMLSMIFKTMQEPEVPDYPRDEKGNVLDSAFQYKYYKSHFWDYVNFADERMLRTPIFYAKIKSYTQQLTPQTPDSIIASVDTIITKARANKEVFKYCVSTLANHYETSNIMGFDKVFVHIAEKYYLTKEAFWADSTTQAKITERVEKIKPNILGTPAHDLTMPDTSFKMHRLYDVKAKYTVLAFWDPTCGHCKKEIPALSQYRDSVRAAGLSFEVFSVGIESDIEEWKKFIRENKLKWVNVSDLYNNTNFRNYYDIYSTPVIYLLDENKKILAKRLDTEKVRDFIQHLEKNKP
jgi:thiol-disulfide isomerase/thioredoxin